MTSYYIKITRRLAREIVRKKRIVPPPTPHSLYPTPIFSVRLFSRETRPIDLGVLFL